MRPDTVSERRQYLSFVLAGGDYAVPILKLKEILQYAGLTPVPGAPRAVRGVLNLRGSVVPVVDLAIRFGVGETAPSRLTCVLVVETTMGGEHALLGVLADSVREVLELGDEDIEPPPPFGTRVRLDHLVGMGKVGEGFVLLLDIDRVLAADDAAAVLGAAAGPAPVAVAGAGAEPPAPSAP
jgi:purine-binding chemotaxis protein CheW